MTRTKGKSLLVFVLSILMAFSVAIGIAPVNKTFAEPVSPMADDAVATIRLTEGDPISITDGGSKEEPAIDFTNNENAAKFETIFVSGDVYFGGEIAKATSLIGIYIANSETALKSLAEDVTDIGSVLGSDDSDVVIAVGDTLLSNKEVTSALTTLKITDSTDNLAKGYIMGIRSHYYDLLDKNLYRPQDRTTLDTTRVTAEGLITTAYNNLVDQGNDTALRAGLKAAYDAAINNLNEVRTFEKYKDEKREEVVQFAINQGYTRDDDATTKGVEKFDSELTGVDEFANAGTWEEVETKITAAQTAAQKFINDYAEQIINEFTEKVEELETVEEGTITLAQYKEALALIETYKGFTLQQKANLKTLGVEDNYNKIVEVVGKIDTAAKEALTNNFASLDTYEKDTPLDWKNIDTAKSALQTAIKAWGDALGLDKDGSVDDGYTEYLAFFKNLDTINTEDVTAKAYSFYLQAAAEGEVKTAYEKYIAIIDEIEKFETANVKIVKYAVVDANVGTATFEEYNVAIEKGADLLATVKDILAAKEDLTGNYVITKIETAGKDATDGSSKRPDEEEYTGAWTEYTSGNIADVTIDDSVYLKITYAKITDASADVSVEKSTTTAEDVQNVMVGSLSVREEDNVKQEIGITFDDIIVSEAESLTYSLKNTASAEKAIIKEFAAGTETFFGDLTSGLFAKGSDWAAAAENASIDFELATKAADRWTVNSGVKYYAIYVFDDEDNLKAIKMVAVNVAEYNTYIITLNGKDESKSFEVLSGIEKTYADSTDYKKQKISDFISAYTDGSKSEDNNIYNGFYTEDGVKFDASNSVKELENDLTYTVEFITVEDSDIDENPWAIDYVEIAYEESAGNTTATVSYTDVVDWDAAFEAQWSRNRGVEENPNYKGTGTYAGKDGLNSPADNDKKYVFMGLDFARPENAEYYSIGTAKEPLTETNAKKPENSVNKEDAYHIEGVWYQPEYFEIAESKYTTDSWGEWTVPYEAMSKDYFVFFYDADGKLIESSKFTLSIPEYKTVTLTINHVDSSDSSITFDTGVEDIESTETIEILSGNTAAESRYWTNKDKNGYADKVTVGRREKDNESNDIIFVGYYGKDTVPEKKGTTLFDTASPISEATSVYALWLKAEKAENIVKNGDGISDPAIRGVDFNGSADGVSSYMISYSDVINPTQPLTYTVDFDLPVALQELENLKAYYEIGKENEVTIAENKVTVSFPITIAKDDGYRVLTKEDVADVQPVTVYFFGEDGAIKDIRTFTPSFGDYQTVTVTYKDMLAELQDESGAYEPSTFEVLSGKAITDLKNYPAPWKAEESEYNSTYVANTTEIEVDGKTYLYVGRYEEDKDGVQKPLVEETVRTYTSAEETGAFTVIEKWIEVKGNLDSDFELSIDEEADNFPADLKGAIKASLRDGVVTFNFVKQIEWATLSADEWDGTVKLVISYSGGDSKYEDKLEISTGIKIAEKGGEGVWAPLTEITGDEWKAYFKLNESSRDGDTNYHVAFKVESYAVVPYEGITVTIKGYNEKSTTINTVKGLTLQEIIDEYKKTPEGASYEIPTENVKKTENDNNYFGGYYIGEDYTELSAIISDTVEITEKWIAPINETAEVTDIEGIPNLTVTAETGTITIGYKGFVDFAEELSKDNKVYVPFYFNADTDVAYITKADNSLPEDSRENYARQDVADHNGVVAALVEVATYNAEGADGEKWTFTAGLAGAGDSTSYIYYGWNADGHLVAVYEFTVKFAADQDDYGEWLAGEDAIQKGYKDYATDASSVLGQVAALLNEIAENTDSVLRTRLLSGPVYTMLTDALVKEVDGVAYKADAYLASGSKIENLIPNIEDLETVLAFINDELFDGDGTEGSGLYAKMDKKISDDVDKTTPDTVHYYDSEKWTAKAKAELVAGVAALAQSYLDSGKKATLFIEPDNTLQSRAEELIDVIIAINSYEQALANVNTAYNNYKSSLTSAQQTEITDKISEFESAIESARTALKSFVEGTADAIDTTVETLKSAFTTLDPNEDWTMDVSGADADLVNAKIKAIEEIESTFASYDQYDYSQANWKKVSDARVTALNNVRSATSTEEVTERLNRAKETFKEVPNRWAELEAYKAEVIKDVENSVTSQAHRALDKDYKMIIGAIQNLEIDEVVGTGAFKPEGVEEDWTVGDAAYKTWTDRVDALANVGKTLINWSSNVHGYRIDIYGYLVQKHFLGELSDQDLEKDDILTEKFDSLKELFPAIAYTSVNGDPISVPTLYDTIQDFLKDIVGISIWPADYQALLGTWAEGVPTDLSADELVKALAALTKEEIDALRINKSAIEKFEIQLQTFSSTTKKEIDEYYEALPNAFIAKVQNAMDKLGLTSITKDEDVIAVIDMVTEAVVDDVNEAGRFYDIFKGIDALASRDTVKQYHGYYVILERVIKTFNKAVDQIVDEFAKLPAIDTLTTKAAYDAAKAAYDTLLAKFNGDTNVTVDGSEITFSDSYRKAVEYRLLNFKDYYTSHTSEVITDAEGGSYKESYGSADVKPEGGEDANYYHDAYGKALAVVAQVYAIIDIVDKDADLTAADLAKYRSATMREALKAIFEGDDYTTAIGSYVYNDTGIAAYGLTAFKAFIDEAYDRYLYTIKVTEDIKYTDETHPEGVEKVITGKVTYKDENGTEITDTDSEYYFGTIGAGRVTDIEISYTNPEGDDEMIYRVKSVKLGETTIFAQEAGENEETADIKDFSKVVVEGTALTDQTLNVEFGRKLFTVEFVTGYTDLTVPTKEVYYGGYVEGNGEDHNEEITLEKEGMTFDGWRLLSKEQDNTAAETNNNRFVFGTKEGNEIKENKKLVAVWVGQEAFAVGDIEKHEYKNEKDGAITDISLDQWTPDYVVADKKVTIKFTDLVDWASVKQASDDEGMPEGYLFAMLKFKASADAVTAIVTGDDWEIKDGYVYVPYSVAKKAEDGTWSVLTGAWDEVFNFYNIDGKLIHSYAVTVEIGEYTEIAVNFVDPEATEQNVATYYVLYGNTLDTMRDKNAADKAGLTPEQIASGYYKKIEVNDVKVNEFNKDEKQFDYYRTDNGKGEKAEAYTGVDALAITDAAGKTDIKGAKSITFTARWVNAQPLDASMVDKMAETHYAIENVEYSVVDGAITVKYTDVVDWATYINNDPSVSDDPEATQKVYIGMKIGVDGAMYQKRDYDDEAFTPIASPADGKENYFISLAKQDGDSFTYYTTSDKKGQKTIYFFDENEMLIGYLTWNIVIPEYREIKLNIKNQAVVSGAESDLTTDNIQVLNGNALVATTADDGTVTTYGTKKFADYAAYEFGKSYNANESGAYTQADGGKYVFAGWFDSEGNPYDLKQAINNEPEETEFTVVARWIQSGVAALKADKWGVENVEIAIEDNKATVSYKDVVDWAKEGQAQADTNSGIEGAPGADKVYLGLDIKRPDNAAYVSIDELLNTNEMAKAEAVVSDTEYNIDDAWYMPEYFLLASLKDGVWTSNDKDPENADTKSSYKVFFYDEDGKLLEVVSLVLTIPHYEEITVTMTDGEDNTTTGKVVKGNKLNTSAWIKEFIYGEGGVAFKYNRYDFYEGKGTFDGWRMTDADGNSIVVDFNTITAGDDDLVITAKWVEDTTELPETLTFATTADSATENVAIKVTEKEGAQTVELYYTDVVDWESVTKENALFTATEKLDETNTINSYEPKLLTVKISEEQETAIVENQRVIMVDADGNIVKVYKFDLTVNKYETIKVTIQDNRDEDPTTEQQEIEMVKGNTLAGTKSFRENETIKDLNVKIGAFSEDNKYVFDGFRKVDADGETLGTDIIEVSTPISEDGTYRAIWIEVGTFADTDIEYVGDNEYTEGQFGKEEGKITAEIADGVITLSYNDIVDFTTLGNRPNVTDTYYVAVRMNVMEGAVTAEHGIKGSDPYETVESTIIDDGENRYIDMWLSIAKKVDGRWQPIELTDKRFATGLDGARVTTFLYYFYDNDGALLGISSFTVRLEKYAKYIDNLIETKYNKAPDLTEKTIEDIESMFAEVQDIISQIEEFGDKFEVKEENKKAVKNYALEIYRTYYIDLLDKEFDKYDEKQNGVDGPYYSYSDWQLMTTIYEDARERMQNMTEPKPIEDLYNETIERLAGFTADETADRELATLKYSQNIFVDSMAELLSGLFADDLTDETLKGSFKQLVTDAHAAIEAATDNEEVRNAVVGFVTSANKLFADNLDKAITAAIKEITNYRTSGLGTTIYTKYKAKFDILRNRYTSLIKVQTTATEVAEMVNAYKTEADALANELNNFNTAKTNAQTKLNTYYNDYLKLSSSVTNKYFPNLKKAITAIGNAMSYDELQDLIEEAYRIGDQEVAAYEKEKAEEALTQFKADKITELQEEFGYMDLSTAYREKFFPDVVAMEEEITAAATREDVLDLLRKAYRIGDKEKAVYDAFILGRANFEKAQNDAIAKINEYLGLKDAAKGYTGVNKVLDDLNSLPDQIRNIIFVDRISDFEAETVNEVNDLVAKAVDQVNVISAKALGIYNKANTLKDNIDAAANELTAIENYKTYEKRTEVSNAYAEQLLNIRRSNEDNLEANKQAAINALTEVLNGLVLADAKTAAEKEINTLFAEVISSEDEKYTEVKAEITKAIENIKSQTEIESVNTAKTDAIDNINSLLADITEYETAQAAAKAAVETVNEDYADYAELLTEIIADYNKQVADIIASAKTNAEKADEIYKAMQEFAIDVEVEVRIYELEKSLEKIDNAPMGIALFASNNAWGLDEGRLAQYETALETSKTNIKDIMRKYIAAEDTGLMDALIAIEELNVKTLLNKLIIEQTQDDLAAANELIAKILTLDSATVEGTELDKVRQLVNGDFSNLEAFKSALEDYILGNTNLDNHYVSVINDAISNYETELTALTTVLNKVKSDLIKALQNGDSNTEAKLRAEITRLEGEISALQAATANDLNNKIAELRKEIEATNGDVKAIQKEAWVKWFTLAVVVIIILLLVLILVMLRRNGGNGGNDGNNGNNENDGNSDEPQEPAPQAPEAENNSAEEEIVAIEETNDLPGDAEAGKKKIRTFEDTLYETSDKNKMFYSQLKNQLTSFKKVKGKLSKRNESFRHGRELVAKMGFAGRTLKLYLALDPNEYDNASFPHKDVSDKKKYVMVPMMVRVKSMRMLNKAETLINQMMEKKGFTPKRSFEPVDYVKAYIKPENTPLGEAGYAQLFCDTADLAKAKEFPTNKAKSAIITESYEASAEEPVKASVTISDINANFPSGATVDLKSLIRAKLVAKNANYVIVTSGEAVTKPLIVKANEIDLNAAKMIMLTGGKAIRLVAANA